MTVDTAATNIKTSILESGLREQRTDLNNHKRSIGGLVDFVSDTRDKIDILEENVAKYLSMRTMFENYKILLFESEFIDKNIEVFFDRKSKEPRYLMQFRSNGRNSYIEFSKFVFTLTNIRDYFSNFSFDVEKFRNLNRIIPVYDFDLIMELKVEHVENKSLHSPHIGGFIFNHIIFKISEFTLEDVDNSINHRFLHVFYADENN